MIIYRIRRQDTHDDGPRDSIISTRETYNVFASQQKAIKEFNAMVRKCREYLSQKPTYPRCNGILDDSSTYIALERIVLKNLSKKNLAMALLTQKNFSDDEQQLRSWSSRRPKKICRTIFRKY